MSRIASIVALFKAGGPGGWLLAGCVLLIFAFFPKEPSGDQLRLVEGEVQSAEIVRDWYGRATRLEFTLRGSPLRYWTGRFPRELTSVPLSSPAQVSFYAEFDGPLPKRTPAGTVKTYGLSVNDREIISVDDDLAGETAFRHYVMPPIGTVFLAIGGFLFYRRNQRGRDRSESLDA